MDERLDALLQEFVETYNRIRQMEQERDAQAREWRAALDGARKRLRRLADQIAGAENGIQELPFEP